MLNYQDPLHSWGSPNLLLSGMADELYIRVLHVVFTDGHNTAAPGLVQTLVRSGSCRVQAPVAAASSACLAPAAKAKACIRGSL